MRGGRSDEAGAGAPPAADGRGWRFGLWYMGQLVKKELRELVVEKGILIASFASDD